MGIMDSLIWVIAICLLAVSTDVVDWICDKVADSFNKRERNK
tara:strand:+ start:37 stop:162 length:126 start_codon:yes stop_codon:yes gene_type:complete